jgi:hypothetical protein
MKKITIQSNEEYADSFFNIKPSSEFVPEWYRLAKGNIHGAETELNPYKPNVTTSTFKKCTPFFDAMTSGYTVFLTADIEVMENDNGDPFVLWRTNRIMVTEHSSVQWEGLPVPEGYRPLVLKWHNQFILKAPKGYSLLFLHPINRFDLPFQTITGIVDCDNWDGVVHFPFFIKKNFIGIIPKGTPIAQIMPIKRDSWKREHKKFDKNFSIITVENFFSTIKRSYKVNNWIKKEYK